MRGLALLVLLLAGCSAQADLDEAVRVEQRLERVPGVLEADVEHVVDPSTPGVARVLLVVDPGTTTVAAQEAVLEALWLSELDPLVGFRLDVQEPDGRFRSGVDPVRFTEVGDELDRRLGPRPVPGR